jgi:SpoVK/Ycf46/Vps4 family AAA+-type ATPase
LNPIAHLRSRSTKASLAQTPASGFDANLSARRSDAVLLFDEADALLGKRSAVNDSHDRYANLEVNYLLQPIESHEGIAMLATNSQQEPIDPDALKHLKARVQIPAPPGPPRSRG